MSTTTSKIRSLGLVCIVAPEVDRSIAFYEQLGFEKRTDVPFGGGYRWVEVYLPESTTGIALAPPRPGDENPEGKETGIALNTDDIDAAHADLKALGIDVDDEVSRMGDPVPPMFWLRDPAGNSLFVVEQQR